MDSNPLEKLQDFTVKCYWVKKKIDKLKTISKFNMGEQRDYLGS